MMNQELLISILMGEDISNVEYIYEIDEFGRIMDISK